uniref:Uncharacterized protein n=1 Tax=Arundo donax TaxID=35708 RepID=A0A0A9AYY2_ARUDO
MLPKFCLISQCCKKGMLRS